VYVANASIPIVPSGTQDVNITNASIAVSGSVDVGNFPTTQDVNITNASIAVSGSVDVGNFPTTQDVNITNASIAVSGSVDVGNFPTTQDVNITNASIAVSGSVDVGNFPTTQDVNITNASIAVSGSVDVGNFPTTQDVNIASDGVGLALDSTLTSIQTDLNFKGTATLWNSASVGIGGVSSAQQSDYRSTILSVFGNTSASTSIVLQMSLDGTTYYDTQYSVTANGDFGFSLPYTFKYIRFKSSAVATITLRIVYC
jgi:hypothetical protein